MAGRASGAGSWYGFLVVAGGMLMSSAFEELEDCGDELLVVLEDPAVPSVGIEDELAVREPSIEVDGVLGGHHPVALAVQHQHRLMDAREVGGPLLTPSVDGLQL